MRAPNHGTFQWLSIRTATRVNTTSKKLELRMRSKLKVNTAEQAARAAAAARDGFSKMAEFSDQATEHSQKYIADGNRGCFASCPRNS